MPRSSYDNRGKNLALLPLVTEVEGVKIHIDGDDGSFWAHVGRNVISRKNLADLKRLISQRTKSITVLLIGAANRTSYEPELTTLEIVGVEKTKGDYGRELFKYRRKDGNLVDSWNINAYPFDPATQAIFQALRAEYGEKERAYERFKDEWRKRWDAETAKLTRLTPEQIKELRERSNDTEILGDGAVPFTAEPDVPTDHD